MLWQNGACLNVINVMGYPDQGPGSNFQGLRMYCAGKGRSGMLVHNDQYRGIEYCYVEKMAPPDDKYYCEPSPDYLKFVDLGGGGLTPVGYGFRSIEYIVRNICRAIDASDGLSEADALAKRRELIKQYDEEGIMATPKNSGYNELVHGGRPAFDPKRRPRSGDRLWPQCGRFHEAISKFADNNESA